MTRAEVLGVLADGDAHYFEPGAVDTLVATGFAEWVDATTFDAGVENKRWGCRPARITDAGRRRALPEKNHV